MICRENSNETLEQVPVGNIESVQIESTPVFEQRPEHVMSSNHHVEETQRLGPT